MPPAAVHLTAFTQTVQQCFTEIMTAATNSRSHSLPVPQLFTHSHTLRQSSVIPAQFTDTLYRVPAAQTQMALVVAPPLLS